MRNLKDFESELNTCSKCGLCQSVCPVYKLTQNECAVSKGKFVMLYGVTKGDLELSKTINKYLDMCTKCGKCSGFCPSGIDVCSIFNVAKFEYVKKSHFSWLIKFFQSKFVFGNFIRFGQIVSERFRKKLVTEKNPLAKVVYFKGCVNQVLPNNDNYIHKIFKNYPIEIIEPNFDCCGLPFLSEGNIERFEQVAKLNSNLLNIDYDYLVTDCASCESTILNYRNYLQTNNDIAEKSVNFGDLIAKFGIRFKFKKSLIVTFHKPCHLEKDEFVEQIFSNCENVKYVQAKGYDDCCGLAGSFSLKNPELFFQMVIQKAKNIDSTGADYVITTCPACLVGLKIGLFLVGSNTKVVSLLEFLSKSDIF